MEDGSVGFGRESGVASRVRLLAGGGRVLLRRFALRRWFSNLRGVVVGVEQFDDVLRCGNVGGDVRGRNYA